MQFVPNGPDVPDALLQAHEDGRVVFFCGAGISYPAGLPGFGGLVKKIYKLNQTTPTDNESILLKGLQFDATLALLEGRLPGKRLAIRHAVEKALKPNLQLKGATDTHAALLKLGRNRDGVLRLVTTNFDRLFHIASKHMKQKFKDYAAPMLPIPKSSRWDGLVYLHGLLPEKNGDETALNSLVLTSGDFGLAYLNERWAARFVTELFRNYVVCFVGYSIADPVLRYMMDALAADRMLGEDIPLAWVFAPCKASEREKKINEWKAKGFSPVLYELNQDDTDHSVLHKTLDAWADIYRDGISGKEHIVAANATLQPSTSTPQDDFVSRMLWALLDPSGLPAKRFADLNPVPSLDWLLEVFTKDYFVKNDLGRIVMQAPDEIDNKLRFSLVRRPTGNHLAPTMSLFNTDIPTWDKVMHHLARWLTRHLNDPKLIIWIANNCGLLHYDFADLINERLNYLTDLKLNENSSELDEILYHAPNSIPDPEMYVYWKLILIGRVRSSPRYDIYTWLDRLKRDGLNTILRLELREILTPKVVLTKPFRWMQELGFSDESSYIKKTIHWEIVLSSDYVRSAVLEQTEKSWTSAQHLLLDDYQFLLRDALDLMRELRGSNDQDDFSSWHLPSIEAHQQNRYHREWVVLIELLRNSWLALYDIDNDRAIQIARNWFDLPYSTFKRLALFAASHNDCIIPNMWADWLLSDNAFCLWSLETQREMFRLLVLQGHRLNKSVQKRLEMAILSGPSKEFLNFDYETDPKKFLELSDRMIWPRLSKLSQSGLLLSHKATNRLIEITKKNPEWKIAENNSDEFIRWMSGTGDPDFESKYVEDIVPREHQGLVEWLRKDPAKERGFNRNTWGEHCRIHLLRSLRALCELAADDNYWPVLRWREALQVWSEEKRVARSWQYAAPLVETMPDDVVLEVGRSFTWWIEVASKRVTLHNDIMLELCARVLKLHSKSSADRSQKSNVHPINAAINHPVGHVTNALVNLWFQSKPKDNEGISSDIKAYLTKICNDKIVEFRHGRVLLVTNIVTLFRVDKFWTEQYLIPLFNWDTSEEALVMWQGFLYSPRLYQPLMTMLKTSFLACAKNYAELGEQGQQLAACLTYTALDAIEGFDSNELRKAIEDLQQKGLEACAQTLVQALDTAGNHREEYWKNRVYPFWKNIWPKSSIYKTPKISKILAQLALAAGLEFPSALKVIKDWLQPIKIPSDIFYQLMQTNLIEKYPNECLFLLDKIVGYDEQHPIAYSKLGECLNKILESDSKLSQDKFYQRLRNYSRI